MLLLLLKPVELAFLLANNFPIPSSCSFEDPDISNNLSSDFPNTFAVSMPTLDANVLCMFNDWKIQRYSDEISTALEAATVGG